MSSSPPRPLPSPKPSPNHSPTRRPLHTRSDSRSNQRSHPPTIRIVADSGPSAYSKSPFPALPSQIFPPSEPSTRPPLDRGSNVSDENALANALSGPPSDEALFPKPLQPRKPPGNRASISTITSSEADTTCTPSNYGSSFEPLSSTVSQTTSPPSSPAPPDFDRPSAKLTTLPEESAFGQTQTIRIVKPSFSSPLSISPTAAVPGPSSASSSTSADDTLRRRRAQRPSILGSPGSPKRFDFAVVNSPVGPGNASPRPVNSTESLAYSDASYSTITPSERPRSASDPTSSSHGAAAATSTGTIVQYPTVHPPSASGSWASVSANTQPRMSDGQYRSAQWSSRLSTIPSESERLSQSLSDPPSVSPPHTRRRRTIGSVISTSEGDNGLSSPSDSSIPIPPPLFGGNRQLPITHASDDEEGDDTLGELQSPQLRPQRSGFLSRVSLKSRPGSSDSEKSMSSQISFAGDLSWVRAYYPRGESVQLDSESSLVPSTPRLGTSASGTTTSPRSDSFPAAIHRPRNRPFAGDARADARGMSDERGAGVEISRIPSLRLWSRSSAFGSSIFSAHLYRDRRSAMAISMWHAPSFDEPINEVFFGRVNRQILLFCIGFLFPLAWPLAAILPLPPKPDTIGDNGLPSRIATEETAGRVYIRGHAALAAGLAQNERRYLKARWWQMMNRIMTIAGVLIILAVITLVVISVMS